MKQGFQLQANGWASEAAISRNYHSVNVLQAAFFTVEYGVIFLVIHSLTSGYNQSCLWALLSETYYYVLEEKISQDAAVPETIVGFKDLLPHQVFIYVLLLPPVEENNFNLIFLSPPTSLENAPPKISP